MKKVKTPWDVTYKSIIFIFGIPIFLIGIFVSLIFKSGVCIFLGVLWKILGSIVKIKSVYDERKLKKFKKKWNLL